MDGASTVGERGGSSVEGQRVELSLECRSADMCAEALSRKAPRRLASDRRSDHV